MKIQKFMTWPLAVTLAGVAGLAVLSFTAPTNLSFTAPANAFDCRFLPPDHPLCATQTDIQCVSKTVDPGLVDEGDSGSFTYVVTVRNNGPSAAENVVVTDTLPSEIGTNATFVSAVPSTGSCNLPPNGSFTCDLGTLANGDVEIVTITVDFSNAAVSDTFKNFASVSTTTTETNTGNNGGQGSACEQSVLVRAVGTPILACLGKTAVPTTLDDGTPTDIVYTVTIKNTGDATATGVQVKDTLTVAATTAPTFVSSNVTCDKSASESLPTGTVITCDVSDLAPNAQTSVVVTVNVADPMSGDAFADSAVAMADGPISSNLCTELVTVPGGEACTPGFWKNHTDLWDVSPAADFETTFGVSFPVGNVNSTPRTLEEAVNTGGGKCKKLLRHGTAAYISALDSGVNFSLTPAQVIQKIQDAVDGGGNCQPEANEFGVLNDNKICLADQ